MKSLGFAGPGIFICFLNYFSFLKGQGIPFDVTTTNISKPLNSVNSNNSIISDPMDDDDEDDVEGIDKTVYDYDDDYDQPSKSTNKTKPKTGIVYSWAKWPKWNKCSRTCGGGIQTRIRNCVEKKQTGTGQLISEFQPGADGVTGCFGVYKKFRMCNQKPCAKEVDFRSQQCATHNKTPYKGKLYEWEGYIKEHRECELNCKPVDINYYTTLSKWVIDGTPCSRPSVYYTHHYRSRAVCVEGICKAVHNTGAIRGATTTDVKTRCGSVLCRPISEIFSKATLPFGYFYISTIGSGATNITIKQMALSENRLVIRSGDNKFIINGNNYISESGTYEYNGDAFEYDKEHQIIESKGPITRSIDVLLFVEGVNPGVKLDYNIPVSSSGISESEESETHWNELGVPLDENEEPKIPDPNESGLSKAKEIKKRRRFSWKLLGFGPCNRSCGAGVRSPIFRCIKDSATRFYTPRRCMLSEKPVFHEDIYKCNLQLCPAYWQTEEYGECVCTDGIGIHNRTVSCVQEQASGVIDIVDAAECSSEMPVESESCDCPKKIRRKIYSQRPDKSSRIYSRLVGSAPNVFNSLNQTISVRKEFNDDKDKSGVWLMSDWNEQCSVQCGSGLEQRSIYCDRTAPYTDVCDLRITPVMSRPCDMENKCLEGTWFTSSWSNCSGDCFNLIKKRTVHCIIDGMVIDDDKCNPDDKPEESKSCTHEEVDYCGPKWHYSEWSECSRSCGEGTQKRHAKCLEIDWQENALQESNSCKYMEREPVYGTCNIQKCVEIASHADSIQNDFADSECIDEFPACKKINKARLCKMSYYQRNCCESCEGHYF